MLEARRKLLVLGTTLAVLGGALGCSERAGAANRDATNDSLAATSATYPDADWTDAKILHTVVTANATDSALGAFAITIVHSSGVKGFAQSMVRDHGSANQLARELAQRASIQLDSVHMDQDDQALATKMNELRKLQGVAVDKGYMQGEVQMHEDVLRAIDNELIPHAQNAELRGYLEKIRPIVASHLDRAQTLKGELDRGTIPAGTR